jgi:leucyl aminopeptidase
MAKKINTRKSYDLLRASIPALTDRIKTTASKKPKGILGQVFVIGLDDRNQVKSLIRQYSSPWQTAHLEEQSSREVIHFSGNSGPVWIFCRRSKQGPVSHQGSLEDSSFSWHRDQVGPVFGFCKAYQVQFLQIQFLNTEASQETGALVGLELAAYTYKNVSEGKSFDDAPEISVQKMGGALAKDIFKKSRSIGYATNVARHLVNSPPNLLNPKSMAQFAVQLLKGKKGVRVDVWNEARLQKERMGLHLGVGQGSPTPPCLVHISYRPSSAGRKAKKPVAFVGKGVTFDTGGLDIKPSSNMRLMKKDMGGSAALVGLAVWIAESQPSIPVDIYLGLAENSVDGRSMRPSDVLQSRNGLSVEIHNTDAEGRLVLADALDVAVTHNDPELVIDVATLTGAIKAGLGAEIAGLFSNDDRLAEDLLRSGTQVGEPSWRMPLYSRYTRGMDSAVADVVNCVDGFGGAITAALFLEKFVKGKSWAHLDIYAWNDRAQGALAFAGGSGQSVQTLIQFLEDRAAR